MSSNEEELIQLLELASKPLIKKDNPKASGIYTFILDQNIEPGDTPITPAKIYDLFNNWLNNIKDTSELKTERITEAKFYKEFKKYFDHCRRRRMGTTYYLLNSSSFDMSEQAEQKLQDRLKKKHGKKK